MNMSNSDRSSADTLRVSAVWVDAMCMSKWEANNVRTLSSCMTSLSLHKLLLIAITRL